MKLYASILSEEYLEDRIEEIKKINYGKIFVLSSIGQEHIVSFQSGKDILFNNVFVVNRVKQTNTLFTINALNHLIKRVNDGIVDTSIRIQWEAYRNSILTIKDGYLQELPTKLKSIID